MGMISMRMAVASLALGVVVSGNPAWAQAVPASASSSAPAAAASSTVEIVVVVKDRTTKAPITASLYSTNGCATYQLSCASFGSHQARRSPSKLSCPQGYKIFARTDDARYHEQSTSAVCDKPQDGDPPIELLFARYNDSTWLADAADALKDTKPNVATVIFAELNQRQPSQANLEDTLRAAAKALNIDEDQALTFDVQQKKKVASPALVKAIRDFQHANNLTEDGILGPETMQKLAGDKPLPVIIRDLARTTPADVKT